MSRKVREDDDFREFADEIEPLLDSWVFFLCVLVVTFGEFFFDFLVLEVWGFLGILG